MCFIKAGDMQEQDKGYHVHVFVCDISSLITFQSRGLAV